MGQVACVKNDGKLNKVEEPQAPLFGSETFGFCLKAKLLPERLNFKDAPSVFQKIY